MAALFFLTDVYAFILSFFGGIVDMITIYRTLPLIIILPVGVYIGDKFLAKTQMQKYFSIAISTNAKYPLTVVNSQATVC